MSEEPSRMQIIESIQEMQSLSETLRKEDHIIGLVPTMGYLHKGHLSLMRKAREETDRVIATIFVNPTQFGPGEDYEKYPVDRESDIKKLREAGVDILFCPKARDVYADGYLTYINVESITEGLCGRSRPTHFRGVATIVAKLFNICKPHKAYFGKKDFQQLRVIETMAKDLNMDIEIIGLPIIREKDGLAMSSRNAYLNPEQRQAALSLNRALKRAEEMIQEGELRSKRVIDEMTGIIESEKGTDIDYIEVCNPATLKTLEIIKGSVLIAVAVHIGRARLIDNCVVSLKK